MPEKPKPAVGYIRVSTKKQKTHGMSLPVQREKIQAKAKLDGLDLLCILKDGGRSAGSLKRSGMQKLLQLVDEGAISAIIITKLDRLFRNMRDFLNTAALLEKKGVNIISVSENIDLRSASSRLAVNIMMSVAQWEREITIERTKEVIGNMKSKNLRVGVVPFGFQVSKTNRKYIEPCPEEKKIVARVKRMHRAGKSLRNIAGELNRSGIRTRKGTPWKHDYIQNLIKPRVRKTRTILGF